eukprot:TRINITY_DN6424_c0_g1_i1.p1 TRINITY_DN6424_c0_g1~~TRINITY_DN6424_c0_g1_i1.p1  ORF type:complete len:474 (+),score=150.07 TRINITY_DN6424_c0_g1_i1:75-1424(+)
MAHYDCTAAPAGAPVPPQQHVLLSPPQQQGAQFHRVFALRSPGGSAPITPGSVHAARQPYREAPRPGVPLPLPRPEAAVQEQRHARAGEGELGAGSSGLWPVHPYAPQHSLGEGDLAMLVSGEPTQRQWALRPGEVGVVTEVDCYGSAPAYRIEGPRGDCDWYASRQVAAVTDRALSGEDSIAAEQLFHFIAPAYPQGAARVVTVLIDSLEPSQLVELLASPSKQLPPLLAGAVSLLRETEMPTQMLPTAQPLQADGAGPLLVAQADVQQFQQQHVVHQAPAFIIAGQQPAQLDPAAVCPASPQVPPQTQPWQQRDGGFAFVTPSVSAHRLQHPSPSLDSGDSQPTVCAPSGVSTPHASSSGRSDADGEPVDRQALGDALYTAVCAIAQDTAIAAKVTGMMLDGGADERALRSLLCPGSGSRLSRHVADAISVLREAGRIPGAPCPAAP